MHILSWIPAMQITADYAAPDAFYQTEPMVEEAAGSGGFGLLIVAGIALIAAFAVVGSMKAKLKTARQQHGAAQYMRANSLNLFVRQDHFLYTSEQRRRIQQPQNGQPMQKGR